MQGKTAGLDQASGAPAALPGPWMSRVRRASATRLALLIAVLAAFCILVLYGVIRQVNVRHSEAVLTQAIDADLAGLVDVFASGGMSELTARLKDRMVLSPIGREASYYALAESSGTLIAANMPAWPSLAAATSTLGVVEIDTGEKALVRVTKLSPQLQLAVGKSLSGQAALQRKLGLGFLISGFVLVGAATGFGALFARRAQSKLVAINETYRQVSAGNYRARTQVLAGCDEMAELAGHTNQLLDHLTQVIDAHRRVTDVTAHEIRTPLMHLDARLLALLKTSENTQLTTQLSEARQSIKRIVDLLDSLLDIAANEVRKGDQAGLAPLDLSGVAAQVTDLYGPSAEDLGIHFDVQIAPNVRILGDRMLLIRLVSNLLDNAFKYSGDGGTVSLTLKEGPILSVANDGPSIPEDQREQIFERYKRAPANTPITLPPSPVGGHGLGLALARAIAERHGFHLTCEPVDNGALFVMQ